MADQRRKYMDWAAELRLRAAGWYTYQVAIQSVHPDELMILNNFVRPILLQSRGSEQLVDEGAA